LKEISEKFERALLIKYFKTSISLLARRENYTAVTLTHISTRNDLRINLPLPTPD
jgi:hypothetical protein